MFTKRRDDSACTYAIFPLERWWEC